MNTDRFPVLRVNAGAALRLTAAAGLLLAAFHAAAAPANAKAAPAGANAAPAAAGPAAAAPAAASPAAAQQAAPAAAFAKVGDTVITHQEFDAAFAQASRGKFYHGKPPEGEVARLQRDVGQGLVDDILLTREAKRRKIQPDAAAVQKTLATYEERYKDSAQWKANRAQVLPGLKAKLERDSVMEQLGKQARSVADPTPAQLEQYYLSHKDKFTSPEQVHLQVILLKVDPSSPQSKWDAALEEAKKIAARLKGGSDFAELAKLHSGDPSADKGGDMGYVHHGMLPEAAQKAVDKLKPGEFTAEPVPLLEGIAVFRLQQRKVPALNPLDVVRERAKDLYLRDKGEEAWTALLVKLRKENPAKIDESRFLPLAKAGESTPAR
jgi:parvulin-like peptidyl-prolyl isomerase